MLKVLTIDALYAEGKTWQIIDVRSPKEYKQGHIPTAINIPLLDDKERAEIGTVYKQKSKDEAIDLGYKYAKPKLEYFISRTRELVVEGAVVIYCWRGGMRSNSFAQHLYNNGFSDVYLIKGGYKSFRSYVLDFFAKPFCLNVLGGYTGSGKTCILKELYSLGEQIIDLEDVANHKGSAFGSLGELPQPTSEHFENILFGQWRHLDRDKSVWIEDESARIGCVQLPHTLYRQMREQQIYFLDIPKKERAIHLVSHYSQYGKKALGESARVISKRLGGQNLKAVLKYLEQGNYYEAAMLTLSYYDKAYDYGIQQRDLKNVIKVQLPYVDHRENANKILELSKT